MLFAAFCRNIIANFNFRSGTRQNFKYKLSSVICHLGATANSGHYTAFVRTGKNWLYFDDDRPVKRKPDLNSDLSFIERNAYIVFYKAV